MADIGLAPTLALAIGLAGGGLLSYWLILRTAGATASDDSTLRRRDLVARRDVLYAELREAEPGSGDREALELSAARVLRELDQLPKSSAEPSSRKRSAAQRPASSSPGFLARHPLFAGAALGGSLVAIVALLVFWAQRDATPRMDVVGGSSAPARNSQDGGFDRGEPPLPAEIQMMVQRLRSQLEQQPENLETRRQLAELLLVHSQFFQAFQEAQMILAEHEDDALANYIAGVVRHTMGQTEAGMEFLDRAIASDATFTQASLIKGVILLQSGDRQAAIAAWETSQQAAATRDPRIARVLEMARAGRSAAEIIGSPP